MNAPRVAAGGKPRKSYIPFAVHVTRTDASFPLRPLSTRISVIEDPTSLGHQVRHVNGVRRKGMRGFIRMVWARTSSGIRGPSESRRRRRIFLRQPDQESPLESLS